MISSEVIIPVLNKLNAECMCYFQYILEENNIYLKKKKPKLPLLSNIDFIISNENPYVVDVYEGRFFVDKKKKEEIFDKNFFNDSLKELVKQNALEFVDILKKNSHLDTAFNELPDCIPFPTSKLTDMKTGFRSRFEMASELSYEQTYTVMFDYQALFLLKMRICKKSPNGIERWINKTKQFMIK